MFFFIPIYFDCLSIHKRKLLGFWFDVYAFIVVYSHFDYMITFHNYSHI